MQSFSNVMLSTITEFADETVMKKSAMVVKANTMVMYCSGVLDIPPLIHIMNGMDNNGIMGGRYVMTSRVRTGGSKWCSRSDI